MEGKENALMGENGAIKLCTVLSQSSFVRKCGAQKRRAGGSKRRAGKRSGARWRGKKKKWGEMRGFCVRDPRKQFCKRQVRSE